MDEIVNLISNIGFPIVCCIILFSLYKNSLQELQNTIKKNTDTIIYLQATIEKILTRIEHLE